MKVRPDALYAWVSVRDGQLRLIACNSVRGIQPLISDNVETLQRMRSHARRHMEDFKEAVHLMRFASIEIIETVEYAGRNAPKHK